MKKACKVIMIEWEDAASYSGKSLRDVEEDKGYIVRTFGVLIHKCDHFHIVMTHDGGTEDSDFIKIPNSLVRKIIYLTEEK